MRKLRYLAPLAAAIARARRACRLRDAEPRRRRRRAAVAAPPRRRPPPPSPAAPVNLVLRYCWSGEGEVKAMESIIQDWNAANPDIQVRGISGIDQDRGDRGGRRRRRAARHGHRLQQRAGARVRPRRRHPAAGRPADPDRCATPATSSRPRSTG